jgi:hypothetical protein
MFHILIPGMSSFPVAEEKLIWFGGSASFANSLHIDIRACPVALLIGDMLQTVCFWAKAGKNLKVQILQFRGPMVATVCKGLARPLQARLGRYWKI